MDNEEQIKKQIESGSVKLSAWAGFQSRQGDYASKDSDEPSDGTVKIDIGGDVAGENLIKEEHINAYKYLVENQTRIKEEIIRSLVKERPEVSNPEELKNLIGLSSIHLLNVKKDKTAYVGYELGCEWDDEHGLGVMTYKDRIIKIGGADYSILSWIAEDDLEAD